MLKKVVNEYINWTHRQVKDDYEAAKTFTEHAAIFLEDSTKVEAEAEVIERSTSNTITDKFSENDVEVGNL